MFIKSELKLLRIVLQKIFIRQEELGNFFPVAAMDFPALLGFSPVNRDSLATVEILEPAADSDLGIYLKLLGGVFFIYFTGDFSYALEIDFSGVFREKTVAAVDLRGRKVPVDVVNR